VAAGVDLGVLLVASVVARSVYSGPGSVAGSEIGLGLIAGLVFLLCCRHWGLYRFQRLLQPRTAYARLAAAAILGVISVVCLLFLLKTGADYSRGAMTLFALFAPPFVIAERQLLGFGLSQAINAGYVRGRRVVMIGEVRELDRLTPQEVFHFGLVEVGRFVLSASEGAEELSTADRSRVRQAIDYARQRKASEYALIVPWGRDRMLSELVAELRSSPLPVRLYADHRTRDILLQKRESDFDPYLSVEVQPEPLTRLEQAAKRGFDIVVSLCALVVLSPVLLIAALLVKMDTPGPIIFRQTRHGFDDRQFKIWKFRTMTVMEDGQNIVQARRGDQRVTRAGRILRRTSIDELPQLINVLRGEMSIVGPRPHAVAHDQEYGELIAEYALRRHVKPGLTGLAQVLGLRGETSTLEEMELRVQKDLWYIDNWSFWLDLKIFFQTLVVLIVNEAY
jgi:undecaprenyl-phosphate galactose phosphotransferase/putative colanic acid biosynthesis UDP-glucose lipid carrier transferase